MVINLFIRTYISTFVTAILSLFFAAIGNETENSIVYICGRLLFGISAVLCSVSIISGLLMWI